MANIAGTLTCDVVVVGAGGAGLAAALRCAVLGLDVVIVTRGRPGGRLASAEHFTLLPGLPVSLRGAEVIERTVHQVRSLGLRVLVNVAATGLEPAPGGYRLLVEGGRRITARAVIVATGASLDGRAERIGAHLLGAGVFTHDPADCRSVPSCSHAFVAGPVETAARVAATLAPASVRVTLLPVAAGSMKSMPAALRQELCARRNINALPGMEIVSADGIARLEVVLLRDRRTGRLSARKAGSLWLADAEMARTEWLPRELERTHSGRLRTATRSGALPAETVWRGVFAASDARAGAPAGPDIIADGIDVADQAYARLAREMEQEA